MIKSLLRVVCLATLALGSTLASAAEQYGYKDGFFLASSDNRFSVQMNALFQGRYTAQLFDGPNANTNGFSVPFSRLYFSGKAFSDWSFLFNYDLAAGAVTGFDAYVDWHKSDNLNFKVGNFKVPYGFDFLVDEHRQQFAANSLVTTGSGIIPGRELGFMLHGNCAQKKVGYWLSVTNGVNGAGVGNGIGSFGTQGANDIDLRYALRATYFAIGHHGFWASDLGGSKSEQLAFSVNSYFDRVDTDANGSYGNTISFGVDGQYASGGLSVLAEYHFTDQRDGANTADHNFSAQGGYFVKPSTEFAVRLAWLQPEQSSRRLMPSGVVNWYLHGHNAKVQFQYDFLHTENLVGGDDTLDHQAIVQLQFYI